MKKTLLTILFLSAFAPVYALAGKDTPPPAQPAAAAEQPSDMDQRIEFARKLHEIQPASAQVTKALEQVGMQLPPQDRDAFMKTMLGAIDDKKLEDMSVQAMAEIFTLPELQRMYGYFSTPEARAISGKMPVYNARMQPEIMKMIDAAMMAARTGGGSAPEQKRK